MVNRSENSKEEAAKRRDEALKRALRMPPKPHKMPKTTKKRGDDRRQTKKAS